MACYVINLEEMFLRGLELICECSFFHTVELLQLYIPGQQLIDGFIILEMKGLEAKTAANASYPFSTPGDKLREKSPKGMP
jgi:hypothetical protein